MHFSCIDSLYYHRTQNNRPSRSIDWKDFKQQYRYTVKPLLGNTPVSGTPRLMNALFLVPIFPICLNMGKKWEPLIAEHAPGNFFFKQMLPLIH